MKPDAIISKANAHPDYYRQWAAVAYKVGALTWNRAEGKFLTNLPSSQRLEVSLSGVLWPGRHCSVGIKLDGLFLGWFNDTKDIPSVNVRAAVDALLVYITPLARNVVEAVKAQTKAEQQGEIDRIRASARRLEAEQRSARDAAIRKADGRK